MIVSPSQIVVANFSVIETAIKGSFDSARVEIRDSMDHRRSVQLKEQLNICSGVWRQIIFLKIPIRISKLILINFNVEVGKGFYIYIKKGEEIYVISCISYVLNILWSSLFIVLISIGSGGF